MTAAAWPAEASSRASPTAAVSSRRPAVAATVVSRCASSVVRDTLPSSAGTQQSARTTGGAGVAAATVPAESGPRSRAEGPAVPDSPAATMAPSSAPTPASPATVTCPRRRTLRASPSAVAAARCVPQS